MTKAKIFMLWMLASTIQFSHNTPHHPQHTIVKQHQLALTWCEHQDQPKQMDCCLRHPPVHQRFTYKSYCLLMASKKSCYQPFYGWRCVSTPIQTGGMTTFGPSTTNPTTP